MVGSVIGAIPEFGSGHSNIIWSHDLKSEIEVSDLNSLWTSITKIGTAANYDHNDNGFLPSTDQTTANTATYRLNGGTGAIADLNTSGFLCCEVSKMHCGWENSTQYSEGTVYTNASCLASWSGLFNPQAFFKGTNYRITSQVASNNPATKQGYNLEMLGLDKPTNTGFDYYYKHNYDMEGSTTANEKLTLTWHKIDLAQLTSTHTGGDSVSLVTTGLTADEHVGRVVLNTTDGSWGWITANTTTTVTAKLRGGTDNFWQSGDTYIISSISMTAFDGAFTIAKLEGQARTSPIEFDNFMIGTHRTAPSNAVTHRMKNLMLGNAFICPWRMV